MWPPKIEKAVATDSFRAPDVFALLVDVAPARADVYTRKAAGKIIGAVEHRVNDDSSRLVDEGVLAVLFDAGQAIGKIACFFKLRFDGNFTFLVYVAPFVAAEAVVYLEDGEAF